MEPFILDNQPPQAGAAAKGSDIRHPGSQAGANATEGAVFGVQHAGSLTGAEPVDGSVFRLRYRGSCQIPGRILIPGWTLTSPCMYNLH